MIKKRKIKWNHPLYTFACCYQRYNKVYTKINFKGTQYRRSTPYKWDKSNKKVALDILESRINDLIKPEKKKIRKVEIDTVYKLIKLFFEIHVTKLSITAKRKFNHTCQHFIKKDFMLDDVEGLFRHIAKNCKDTNLHVNTTHKLLSNLRQMFSFAVDRGYIIRNPVTKELIPKIILTEIMVFTDEEMKEILNHQIKKDRPEFYQLIRFIMITGVRIQEALKIHWFDISDDCIEIRGKGRRNRQFPRILFPELREILSKLRIHKERNRGKLFYWSSYAKLEKWLRDTCKDLGIYKKGKNFHSIRKYCENYLINNDDFTPYEVAEIMGHSIRVQEAHYKEVLGARRLTEKIINRRKLRNMVSN